MDFFITIQIRSV